MGDCAGFDTSPSLVLVSASSLFLAAISSAVSSDFAVETLIVFHKFLFLFFGVCLSIAARCIGSVDFYGVDVHCVSSLRGGASSSAVIVVVTVSSDSECLVESSACIWAIGAKFLPFSVLFVGFFDPSLEGPGDLWIVMVSADDSVEKSSFES